MPSNLPAAALPDWLWHRCFETIPDPVQPMSVLRGFLPMGHLPEAAQVVFPPEAQLNSGPVPCS